MAGVIMSASMPTPNHLCGIDTRAPLSGSAVCGSCHGSARTALTPARTAPPASPARCSQVE